MNTLIYVITKVILCNVLLNNLRKNKIFTSFKIVFKILTITFITLINFNIIRTYIFEKILHRFQLPSTSILGFVTNNF